MPNQPAKNKQSVTVFLTKELVAQIDQIANADDRSRSYIINKILEEQVALALAGQGMQTKAQEATDPAVQAIIDKAIAAQQRIIDAEQDVGKLA
jgi:metal-responsive CopG/Arc/MetJ family transcriptional regulator|tara:strand:- start:218 stop:499 length:282 start_codon:yes stop_codon:yes gene_type:complete